MVRQLHTDYSNESCNSAVFEPIRPSEFSKIAYFLAKLKFLHIVNSIWTKVLKLKLVKKHTLHNQFGISNFGHGFIDLRNRQCTVSIPVELTPLEECIDSLLRHLLVPFRPPATVLPPTGSLLCCCRLSSLLGICWP